MKRPGLNFSKKSLLNNQVHLRKNRLSWIIPLKMHFLPVLGLMSDSLTTILVESHWCPSNQFILQTQGPILLNFAKRYWELTVLKNVVFLSWPFWIFFSIFFFSLLNPMKSSQRFLGSKDGSKFWWLPWFPAHEVLGQHLCTGLYLVPLPPYVPGK